MKDNIHSIFQIAQPRTKKECQFLALKNKLIQKFCTVVVNKKLVAYQMGNECI